MGLKPIAETGMEMDERPPAREPDAAPRDEPTAAEALIASLEADGQNAEPGHFTLDPEAARRKMRQFQLKHPHHYVLLLVQAAVLRGATHIWLHVDRDDLRMVFDGRGFSLGELEGLYNALFTRAEGDRRLSLQELALAVNAAEALRPKFVRIRSTVGDQTCELEARPGEDFTVTAAPPHDGATAIHVRVRLSAALVDALRNPLDPHPLKNIIRIRCRYAEARIELNGKRLLGGLRLPDALGHVPVRGAGLRGAAGWPVREFQRSEVRIVKNGAWVGTVLPSRPVDGFVAVIDGYHLRKTLSQDGIVRDDAYQQAMASVEEAYDRSVKALCDTVKDRAAQSAPHDLLWQLLRRLLEQSGLPEAYLAPPSGTLLDAIARAPLWRASVHGGAVDQPVSLRDLLDHLGQGGCVGYYLQNPYNEVPGTITVTLPTPIYRLVGRSNFLVLQDLGRDDLALLEKLLPQGSLE